MRESVLVRLRGITAGLERQAVTVRMRESVLVRLHGITAGEGTSLKLM